MSDGNSARQKDSTKADERHPTTGLIEQADARGSAEATASAPRPAAPPSAVPRPAPGARARDAGTSATTKKQVNYRLDPVLIDDLRNASIVYSFQQRRQISQNQIVETAIREWLDSNGPWEI
jgi:hypothetical protein